MFFNRFTVCIISPEKKIEAAFSRVPQPEDSEFELKTYSKAEDYTSAPDAGRAVIVDCSALNGDIPGVNKEYAVLLISADAPPSDETLEKADEAWVMPKDRAFAEKLLKLNFRSLMDDMKRRAGRELDAVLESMPYAVIIADRHGSVVRTNSKFGVYFPEDGGIIGGKLEAWKEKALAGHILNADGNTEITRSAGDELKTLVFSEQPIVDTAGEAAGSVSIIRDITPERAFELQTLQNANTDFMTGLHNRRSLFSYLELVKTETQLSLITIDLDNFKTVNDTFGHQTGDEALIDTAALLKKCFPNDFIARLGGDEFLVVISGMRSESELESSTANLLVTLCEFYRSRGEFLMMTASAGIAYAVVESGSHDIEKLMVNSDTALYCAKNSGKASYKLYGKAVREGITVRK